MQYADVKPVGGRDEWWALYTRHQHEKVVADMLLAKNFDVFLPLYSAARRWKDRQKVLSLPLFPGYVFVKGGLERRLQVITTPGVHMILCHGERIATIPDDQIETIRRTIDGAFRVEPHPFLKCGDRVRVSRGSLEGVEGILIRKKNVYRLIISVEMLAQSVAVEIDAADVKPVSHPVLAGACRMEAVGSAAAIRSAAPSAGLQWGADQRNPDVAPVAI